MKYTKEIKLECVMKYKNGDHIDDPPGVNHKAFHNQILRWVRQYDSLGEFALDHNRPTLSIEERISLKRKGLTPLQFRHQSLSITI